MNVNDSHARGLADAEVVREWLDSETLWALWALNEIPEHAQLYYELLDALDSQDPTLALLVAEAVEEQNLDTEVYARAFVSEVGGHHLGTPRADGAPLGATTPALR